MAVVHKIGHSSYNAHWVYKTYYLALVYEITPSTVRTEPTKAFTPFLVNNEDHQEAAAYLIA